MGTPLCLNTCAGGGELQGNGVWPSLYDIVVSWLRLQTPIECIPHPYWMYAKCFSTLRCCGWAYGYTLALCRNTCAGGVDFSQTGVWPKAKYFLIKNYYDSGEIDLRYCPTDVMWADVLTKPLQGQKFRDMRSFLQNCPRDYDDDVELQTDQLARRLVNQQVKTVALLRECVGEQTNLQINPPRSRSRSPTCVSELQVNSKKHMGPKKESLHNKRKVTFKQDGPHVLPRQTGHYGQQNHLRQ
jgi:hypothetical protein